MIPHGAREGGARIKLRATGGGGGGRGGEGRMIAKRKTKKLLVSTPTQYPPKDRRPRLRFCVVRTERRPKFPQGFKSRFLVLV